MIHNETEIAELKQRGIHVIKRGDREYPRRLENLHTPPEIIYAKGNLGLLTKQAVSIVGTRNCTRYGIDVAKRFAKVFAESGLVVVSGLADGIDSSAHVGAGAENTIAVIGTGFNHYFPVSNRKLQDEIGEKGLLISEYPPADHGQKFYFPQRNRIVAALGNALLIVEADLKSGTMITKDFALDLGIDVFAVPGPVTSLQSRGTNDLIKQASCAIATEPGDVLEVFGVTARKKGKESKNTLVQISFEEKRVIDILGKDEVHIDELVEKIDMPIRKLATLLTEMEMRGLIEKIPGNMFASLV